LWTLQAPFSAFEKVAMLLLVTTALASVGIGLLSSGQSPQGFADRRGVGVPRIAVSTYNFESAR
jgi:hypothetical protein